MARIDMTLNPLVLFNLEFAGKTKIDLTNSDTLLTDICWDSSARTLSDLQARYLELRESIPEVDRSKLIPFAQFERKCQKGRVDHIISECSVSL